MQPGGEKRGLAQCIQHQTGGRLRGTVTGKHRFGRGRAQPHGAQGRHAADEAVHYHGHAFQRTAQKDAAQPGKIKAAQLGQHVQRVCGVRLVAQDAPADGIHLAGQPFIRKAGSPAGHPFHRLAQQHRCHRTGSGGVANAHFAGGQQLHTGSFLLLHQPDAPADGLHSLGTSHGGTLREIGSTGGNAAVCHPRHRVSGHAHVHGHHIAVGSTGHLAHAGTPGSQILRHCAGHALVGLAHALSHHAVVGAEHQHSPAGNIQRRTAGEGGGIFQQSFQCAQPAQRFGQPGPVGVGGGAGSFIRRGDAGK